MKANVTLLLVILLIIGIAVISYMVLFRKDNKKAEIMHNKKQTVYVLLGAPGSGKGTLAERCVDRLGFKQISTGNLFRQHIADQTEIGKKIQDLYKAGGLMPDEMVIDMVRQEVKKYAGTAVPAIFLDGFPRTKVQVDALVKMFKEPEFAGFDVKLAHISLPSLDVAFDRLTSRVVCGNKECQATYSGKEVKQGDLCKKCGSPLIKRSDDDVLAIRKRLDTYAKTEKDILEGFIAAGVPVIRLDGTTQMEDVYNDFLAHIK